MSEALMGKKTGRPLGRPPGKDYPAARTMLLTTDDLTSLQRLAEAWGCSGAEVVRRLIRREAKLHERRARREEPTEA